MPQRRSQPARGTRPATAPEPTHAICGARKRDGSDDVCKRPAGWGTPHPGTGRCKLHGGCSTGPKDRQKMSEAAKGNKNGRKHGLYEKVVVERLTPEERAVFEQIGDEESLRTELKILRFKLLRLLEPCERAMVIGAGQGEGQEIQMVEIDEVTKAYAIEKLVDGIRKILRDLKDADEEHDSFEQLLAHVATMRGEHKAQREAE